MRTFQLIATVLDNREVTLKDGKVIRELILKFSEGKYERAFRLNVPQEKYAAADTLEIGKTYSFEVLASTRIYDLVPKSIYQYVGHKPAQPYALVQKNEFLGCLTNLIVKQINSNYCEYLALVKILDGKIENGKLLSFADLGQTVCFKIEQSEVLNLEHYLRFGTVAIFTFKPYGIVKDYPIYVVDKETGEMVKSDQKAPSYFSDLRLLNMTIYKRGVEKLSIRPANTSPRQYVENYEPLTIPTYSSGEEYEEEYNESEEQDFAL